MLDNYWTRLILPVYPSSEASYKRYLSCLSSSLSDIVCHTNVSVRCPYLLLIKGYLTQLITSFLTEVPTSTVTTPDHSAFTCSQSLLVTNLVCVAFLSVVPLLAFIVLPCTQQYSM